MYKAAAVIVSLLVLAAGAAVLIPWFEQRDPPDARYERPLYTLAPITEPRVIPGPVLPGAQVGGPNALPAENPYQGNAHAIADGYVLYRWMNCDGCHGEGGGSIGPTLWDDSWIYGGSAAEIAESILRGRPDGMPAYGGRLTEDQLWRIVAYVQQLEPGGRIHRAGDL